MIAVVMEVTLLLMERGDVLDILLLKPAGLGHLLVRIH